MATQQSTASEVLEDLVRSAAAGDRPSQQILLTQYWPVIRYAVRGRKNRMGRRLAAREETQDLEQAAAMRVLTELQKHNWRGRSAFGAWVKKLSQLNVVDAYRHHSAQKRDAGVEAGLTQADNAARPVRSAESVFDDQHKIDVIMQQVSQLKPEYATALLMHHMGYSHADIADTLDCTTEAARKLVTRARAKLVALKQGG